MLVEEQAALPRVAVTVATESTAERVFDVVTEEVARLLGATPRTSCPWGRAGGGCHRRQVERAGRPDPGRRTVIVIARGSAIDRVARTGAPARLATDDPASLRSSTSGWSTGRDVAVAAPIVVVRRDLGALVVSVTRDLQLAPNAEERLGQFAEPRRVAIADAQAREALAILADEQAA